MVLYHIFPEDAMKDPSNLEVARRVRPLVEEILRDRGVAGTDDEEEARELLWHALGAAPQPRPPEDDHSPD